MFYTSGHTLSYKKESLEQTLQYMRKPPDMNARLALNLWSTLFNRPLNQINNTEICLKHMEEYYKEHV